MKNIFFIVLNYKLVDVIFTKFNKYETIGYLIKNDCIFNEILTPDEFKENFDINNDNEIISLFPKFTRRFK
jgi:hypothetical protein